MKRLIFGCILSICSIASATTHVALVRTSTAAKADPLLDLATVRLGSEPGLKLVERELVEKVLDEQKLNLSGLVSATDSIRIGQLIQADLFAVLEGSGDDKSPPGLVVYDAATGLRLWDSALPSASPDGAADGIVEGVRQAARKNRQREGKAVRLLSFAPVRNVDLDSAHGGFCEAVSLLIERQIGCLPDVVILERNRLEHVNRERTLPTATPAAARLWSSLLSAQVDIGKGADGKALRGSVALIDSEGKAQSTPDISVESESAADLANQLCAQLQKLLDTPSAAQQRPFDRTAEAARFAHESDLLVRHSLYTASLRAAEAAYALDPVDIHQARLSRALWTCAVEALTPEDVIDAGGGIALGANVPLTSVSTEAALRSLALARYALDHQHRLLLRQLPVSGKSAWFDPANEKFWLTTWLYAFTGRIDSAPVTNNDSAVKANLAGFYDAMTAYMLDKAEGLAQHTELVPETLQHYNCEIKCFLTMAKRCAGDVDAYIRVRDRLVERWLIIFDRIWSRSKDIWCNEGLRQSLVMRQLLNTHMPSHWPTRDPDAYARTLDPIARSLLRSTCPMLKLYGRVAQRRVLAATQPSQKRDEDLFKDLEKQVRDMLDGAEALSDQVRDYCILALLDVILLSDEPALKPGRTITLLKLISEKRLLPSVALLDIAEREKMLKSADETQARVAGEILGQMFRQAQAQAGGDPRSNVTGVSLTLARELSALGRHYPAMPAAGAMTRCWDEARILLETRQAGDFDTIEHAIAGKDVLYVLASGRADKGRRALHAFAIDVKSARPDVRRLASVEVHPVPAFAPVPPGCHQDRSVDIDANVPVPGAEWDGFKHVLIQGAASDDRHLYVSVRHQGIVIFPLDGTAAKRVTEKEGLPSDWVQPLAVFNGLLYAGMSSKQGGYLAACDPHSGSVRVVVSSRRTRKQSPLDDVAKLTVESLAVDEPRNRLICGVSLPIERESPGDWSGYRSGLWEMSGSTGAFKQLLTVGGSSLSPGELLGFESNRLFVGNTLWTIAFDLPSDTARYVSLDVGSLGTQSYIKEVTVDEQVARGFGWNPRAFTDPEKFCARRVVGGWMWVGSPFIRMSRDCRTTEMLDPAIGPGGRRLDTVTVIEPVGDDHVVVGDKQSLMLLHIKK
jgi:hypothetical protein